MSNQVVELWINKMTEFIFGLDIDDYLKNLVRESLIIQKDLIKNGMVTDVIFGTLSSKNRTEDIEANECLLFMDYLNYLITSKGNGYLEMAIKYSLESSSDMSFIDNFIRFITITNYSDIEIVDQLDSDSLVKNVNDYNSGQGFMRAYLGGFLLCDLSSFTFHNDGNGNKYLDFYNFHSRKNMTRTKVGSLLIKKLLQKMLSDELLCDSSLGSVWVMKNNALGKNFYKKLGFKFLGPSGEIVGYDYYDDCIKVAREDYPQLSEKEFYNLRKRMGGNFCVIIPSEDKKELLEQEFTYPYIEYNGRKINWTTDFSDGKGRK